MVGEPASASHQPSSEFNTQGQQHLLQTLCIRGNVAQSQGTGIGIRWNMTLRSSSKFVLSVSQYSEDKYNAVGGTLSIILDNLSLLLCLSYVYLVTCVTSPLTPLLLDIQLFSYSGKVRPKV